MATERQKKEKAKQKVRDIVPSIPPVGPFALPGRLLKGAENLAVALIEADPLDIITSDQALQTIANDDSVMLTPKMIDVINDPMLRIMSNGDVVRRTGRDVIKSSGQFSRANLISGLTADVSPTKRTRKKTSTDKKMSKALRLANQKFRTTKGKLRKGATQAQIMRYAHKLLKKMR